jgi:hypothetical protein
MFNNFSSLLLRNAPRPVKALALSYTLSLSLAYLYAIGNIAMVVGLTPKDIAVHYYGASEKLENTLKSNSGEQEFSLSDEADEPKPTTVMRPSFKNLVGIGHFHLFGMSSFFFGLALLGLFTKVNEQLKCFLVFIPFVTVALDNLSFLATRFLGPGFAYLTAISGAAMGFAFLALWAFVIREIFSPSEGK